MLYLELHRDSSTSLGRQLYDQLRTRIFQGDLQAGTRMPSSRNLAKDYQIARNTVIEVYEQLIAEGFLATKQGSGTFVNDGAYFSGFEEKQSPIPTPPPSAAPKNSILNFAIGTPDISLFPRGTWAKHLKQVCDYSPDSDFHYGNPDGDAELQAQLTDYLSRTKGIHCSPAQVLIFNGSHQALILAATLLRGQSGSVLMEDPGYSPLQKAFADLGLNITFAPVDSQGMTIDHLKSDSNFDFVCVTPSHQYPTGTVLSIQRRLELLNYAEQQNSYILENDYDSEFRYSGFPVPSLYRLNSRRVIHVGTFSQCLYPAIRMGFMVLPESLLEKARYLKRIHGLTPPFITQRALAGFIREGQLERLIAKMKKHYNKKQIYLLNGLKQRLSSDRPVSYNILGDAAGLHIVLQIPRIDDSRNFRDQLLQAGLRISGFEYYSEDTPGPRNCLLMGFGALNEQEIDKGLDLFTEQLRMFLNN